MADCLACSGCVTTAETVLVEQHSLKTLRTKLEQVVEDPAETKVCFTISPATLADLSRYLELPSDDAATMLEFQQRGATFLQATCRGASVLVLNGLVPLSWSLQEAAQGFCEAYRQSNRHNNDDNDDNMEWTPTTIEPPCPSIAVSALEYEVLSHPGARNETCRNGWHNDQAIADTIIQLSRTRVFGGEVTTHGCAALAIYEITNGHGGCLLEACIIQQEHFTHGRHALSRQET